MSWSVIRVIYEVKTSINSISGIRMNTPYEQWTEEQIKLITKIEKDLVKLINTLK